MKMKWRSLFCLLTCLLMHNLVSGDGVKGVFSVDKKADQFVFICEIGNWQHLNESKISLSYKDRESGDYKCGPEEITVTVKFRTCESCIELDAPSLSIVIVGNILATCFVAYAVYSITGQPKNKSFSGNKASDKVTLLNGEQDTYQQLNPGQSAEYSRLKGGRRA